MLSNNNVSLLRGAFERTAVKFSNFITQRQELRVELPLLANQNQYNFNLKQGNSTSDGPNAVLINDQDAFVWVASQIYVRKQDSDPTQLPVQYNNQQRFTYPEPQVFVGAPAGKATEYQALWTLWNGILSFKTGSLERIKAMDLYSHLYAPQSQVVPPLEDVLSITNPTVAEFNGPANDAWVELQPTFLLDGNMNNIVTITLGAGDITAIAGNYNAAGSAETSQNYLGIRLLGVLIAQGSQQAKQFSANWNG